MSYTTYVVLAIDHGPETTPHLWDWQVLGDHPDRIEVLTHAQVLNSEGVGLSEQVRDRWQAEWLMLALEQPLCLRCGATREEPDRECSLCFRRSSHSATAAQ
ncbi:hypothetical protein ACFV9C_44010 [Kribbella sp. NPDC059898]|uniref:hypothetical protein n=1 Tax=Kribbella sp. NPDC059898 TaxID=3346995 RepID=UPI00366568A7